MRTVELVEEFGSLAVYFWQYEPEVGDRPERIDYAMVVSLSKMAESVAMSKNLNRCGWPWVGPTTAYAFMQSVGMANNPVGGCEWRDRTGKTQATV